MQADPQGSLQEIDEALEAWRALRAQSALEDCADQPLDERVRVNKLLAGALKKHASPGSPQENTLKRALATSTPVKISTVILVEALTALRGGPETPAPEASAPSGHVQALAGFLEIAGQLYEEGRKDAAALIAGSTLYHHLRALCSSNGIAPSGAGYDSADLLNAELAGRGIYDASDQKNVLSCLQLWRDAACGRYDHYIAAQVQLLINAVTEFIARHPA